MPSRARALTLLEMLVVVAFVGIGAVGIARLVGHAIRIGDRAQRRTELTTLAFTELETLRAAAHRGDLRPDLVRIPAGGREQLRVSSSWDGTAHLFAIEVTATAFDTVHPLSVTLTGWVSGEEAPP